MATGKRKVGTITIGQSPRMDITPEMQEILGSNCELLEGGALDALSMEEIEQIAPKEGEYVLVTRLRNGISVQVAEHHILPRMQGEIDRLEEAGAEVVALLCTGEFPGFRSSRLLLEPQKLLSHFVAGVAGGRRLGVVVPAPEQIEEATSRWQRIAAADLMVVAGSPYGDISETERAATALKEWEAHLVVLDCMGFTKGMKQRAAEIAGVPVILPRTVLARTLAELM